MLVDMPTLGTGITPLSELSVMRGLRVAGRLKMTATNIARTSKVVGRNIATQRAQIASRQPSSLVNLRV